MALTIESATSLMETSSFSPTKKKFIVMVIIIILLLISSLYSFLLLKIIQVLTRQNDRINFLIFSQGPDEKLSQVTGINELTERLTSTTDNKWSTILYKKEVSGKHFSQ